MKCRRLGYISKYSRENPDEDFAEMVAWMLTRTKEDFDKLIDDPRLPAEAQNKLVVKRSLFVSISKKLMVLKFMSYKRK